MIVHSMIDKLGLNLVSSGDIELIQINREWVINNNFDELLLHDAIIVGICFYSEMSNGSILVLSGIFPDMKSAFRMEFVGCSQIKTKNIPFGKQIGIDKVKISNLGRDFSIKIAGEFLDQNISFQFQSASYKKFILSSLLTRAEAGWD